MAKIRITVEEATLAMSATLNESESAKKLLAILPCESEAQTWGDEVYFEIPLSMGEENARAEVASGTICYWPTGKSFCIFFGQTPYSPVNLLGTLDGDPKVFARVEPGQKVRLAKLAD